MMSQARAKTFQSLNYLFKVCNISRSSYSSPSLNLISFPKKFSTINSAVAHESLDSKNVNEKIPDEDGNNWSFNHQFDQNPNGVYGGNSMGRVYGPSYNLASLRSEFQSNSDGNYNGNHVQHSIPYNINHSQTTTSFEQAAVESGQHFAAYQQHTNIPNEKGVWGNGVYSGSSLSNQQNSGMNYQIPNGSYSDKKLDEASENGGLRGTIEELDAFCKERKMKEAVEVLGLLKQNNVSVDIPRYLFLMNECGEAQALEEAKTVHEHLARSVSHIDVRICNKILEMYSKCGSMEDAYKVFVNMSQRNLTSWDTMITWFAKNGHGEDAIDMFNEFKKAGLKPDNQMFFGVLTACSVLGDMKEGLLHFESMTKDYNIVASMDHYKSVVDMLGSAGYLNEALEFVEKMPIEPSVEIWEVMMNQSRVHGDTELGDRCAELIELLEPSRLDEQSKLGLIPIKASDIANEKEKKRLSSLNPLEIKTKVYEYRAGDTSHPDHQKLYSQLRCLKQPMKEFGYVPETKFVLHDIDQESKEEALLSHSERLALSQALLTSPARSPIRIIKNLRVCGDCHNALKIISKLVGRLIVARDAKRFHHFENGVCSCGDYW